MYLILLILLSFAIQLSAQEDYTYAEIDSLLNLYEANRQYDIGIKLSMDASQKSGKQDSLCGEYIEWAAYLYQKANQKDKAIEYYNKALNIFEEAVGKNSSKYAITINFLALLHQNMGNYTQAMPLLIQAKNIRENVLGTEHPDFAASLNNLASLHNSMGNYDQALPLYIQSKNIYEKALGTEHPNFATSLSNLAQLYSVMGNYDQALPTFIQAKNIREEVLGTEHPDFALSLNNLALLHKTMGNYDQALPLYIQAKNIYEKTLGMEHLYFATSLNNLAQLHSVMGNYDQALPLLIQAKNIREKVLGVEHPDFANSLNNLAGLYESMGNYDQALPLYIQAKNIREKVLGIEHPYFATSLNNLAVLHEFMGNYDLALPLYIQAKNILEKTLGMRHSEFASSLNNLAGLYRAMGEYTKAESYYSQCFSTKNANLSNNFSWLSEKGKAAYWQKEKGFYQRLNNYAAQATEKLPQAAALAYNSNLITKGLLLESAKEVEDAALASKDDLTIKIYKELKDKRRLINHLVSSGTGKKTVIARYEIEADSLDKILVSRLGEYAISKHKFQITWKDVQNELADNEIAIEFARYFNEKDSQCYYMALLVKKGYEYPKLVKLGSEKNISSIPAGKGFADLYKLIWEPIDSLLQDVKIVYYSPDGVLNNIAFAALCSKGTEKVLNTKEIKRGAIGKTKGAEIENCTYLSDRYTLHQVSITRYLSEGLKNSKIDNSLLVFGGVNYDEIPTTGDTIAEVQVLDFEDYALAENINRSFNNQNRMNYLPGTQTELQNVQKIMHKKQWKIRAFSNKNASENTLKTEIQKESPSVLHIATHGFAFPDIHENKNTNKTYRDADNPMARCGLLLAGANHSWTGNPKTVLSQTGEDGILTALEVSSLPLKSTKLVVLSACETGLGKIQGTEGVFGLKRGFKLALVEQIIVSLWSVPDKETMELMDIFYNDLAKTHNAVQSFEKAQKEMRKKYATRPDLWAGFVLVR